jgi:hypothetical protein
VVGLYTNGKWYWAYDPAKPFEPISQLCRPSRWGVYDRVLDRLLRSKPVRDVEPEKK